MADESKSTSTSETGSKKVLEGTVQYKLYSFEKWLNGIFGEKFPLQIPKSAREWIVKYAPWLALAGGAIGVWACIAFWRAGHFVDEFTRTMDRMYGVGHVENGLGFMWYLALVVLAIQSALMIMAFKGLKGRKKNGWSLLFYSSLAVVLLGVVELFVAGYGFGSLLGSLVGAILGMFIIFQIRNYYS